MLPCFNEEANVSDAVAEARAAARAVAHDHEVIVVDDGSSDRTRAIAEALALAARGHVRVVAHERNRGYGAAVRSGLQAARMDWILLTDGDRQFDVAEVADLAPLTREADIVAGFRIQRMDPLHRRMNAAAWNWLVRRCFAVPVRDVDCAFKLMRRSLVQRLDLSAEGAMVSTELVAKASARGAHIVEVGVHHRPRVAGDVERRLAAGDPAGVRRARGDPARDERRAGRRSAPRRRRSARGRRLLSVPSAITPFSPPRARSDGYALQRVVRVGVPALVLVLAGALRLSNLGAVAPNPYYDAAVRTMSLSWHNLFYGVFAPGSGLGIDKPPVDLWLQVATTKLLGFSTPALLLPQAIAGTLAVLLLFDLLRGLFGWAAGVAGALALAVLPVAVITARSDTMDAVMCALILGAACLIGRAARPGAPRSLPLLLGAGALYGLAFEVKILEALVALPALLVLYWLSAAERPAVRARRLAAMAAVFGVVALSWLTAVSIAPGQSRPWYIGSTNGSPWNATFVFNGVDRILGPPAHRVPAPSVSQRRTSAQRRASAARVQRAPRCRTHEATGPGRPRPAAGAQRIAQRPDRPRTRCGVARTGPRRGARGVAPARRPGPSGRRCPDRVARDGHRPLQPHAPPPASLLRGVHPRGRRRPRCLAS